MCVYLAHTAFEGMRTASLSLPASAASGPVATRYLTTEVEPSSLPPVLLVHGFDISSLEWRRLMPKLQEAGIEVRERERYNSHTCVHAAVR